MHQCEMCNAPATTNFDRGTRLLPPLVDPGVAHSRTAGISFDRGGVLNVPAKKKMSAGHKAALAVGREEGRAVRDYLNALEAHQPKRGRKRTPDSINKRLATIDAEMDTAEPIKRLSLAQERIDLEDELAGLENADSIDEYEAAFVEAAAGYSERKGISYPAWREVGVPAATLKAAGVARS
jgi:hypothetical protein